MTAIPSTSSAEVAFLASKAQRSAPSERAARLARVVTLFDYQQRELEPSRVIVLKAPTEAESVEEMEALLQEAFHLLEQMATEEGFSLEVQENVISIYEAFVTALDELETPMEVVDALCCLLDDMIYPVMDEIDLESSETNAFADRIVAYESQIKALVAKLLPGEDVETFLAARASLVEDFEEDEEISSALAKELEIACAGAGGAFQESREESMAEITAALDSAASQALLAAEEIKTKLMAVQARASTVVKSLEAVKLREMSMHQRLEALRKKTLAQQAAVDKLFEGIGHKV